MSHEHIVFTLHRWCMNYAPVIWLQVISHSGIAIAYFAIPWLVIRFLIRQQIKFANLPFFWLAAAFVLLCGLTHTGAIWVILIRPDYLWEGVLLAITAIVSLAAFGFLVPALRYVSGFKDLEAYRQANHNLRNQITAQSLQIEELAEIVRQGERTAQIERKEIIEKARLSIQKIDQLFGTISNAMAAKSDPDNS
jgi:two-component system NtrC family sensor kinase